MNQLKVIEKNDQRVLTSVQLAEAFGTDVGKIRYNFSYNKKRYQEGKHYFVLRGDELKDFKTEREIHTSLKKVNTLYLWTEKGAFLHAKSLNTDKAWDAYSALVDDYFKKTEQLQRANIPSPTPQTIEDIMITQLMSLKELKAENKKLREEVSHLSLVVDNEIWLTDNQKAAIQEAVNKRVGKLKSLGYDAHFQGIYRALKNHFTVPNYSKIKRADFDIALDIIAGWYPKKKDDAS